MTCDSQTPLFAESFFFWVLKLVVCPVVPSSVLRGRLGRVGYSGGRGGVIWRCAVYIILERVGGGVYEEIVSCGVGAGCGV